MTPYQRASVRLASLAPVARAIQVEFGHRMDPCDPTLWEAAVALWRGTQDASTDLVILRGMAEARAGRSDPTGYNSEMAPVLAER